MKAALLFGFFQGLMPLAGYLLGMSIRGIIQGFDHWVAFVLLSVVGGKMLFGQNEDESENLYSTRKLVLLAIATSIDALVVGITFSFIEVNLFTSVLTIGLVTTVLCVAAGLVGRNISHINSKWFVTAGGLAIIGIGLKILLNHLLL